jgi:hypothetical protein
VEPQPHRATHELLDNGEAKFVRVPVLATEGEVRQRHQRIAHLPLRHRDPHAIPEGAPALDGHEALAEQPRP